MHGVRTFLSFSGRSSFSRVRAIFPPFFLLSLFFLKRPPDRIRLVPRVENIQRDKRKKIKIKKRIFTLRVPARILLTGLYSLSATTNSKVDWYKRRKKCGRERKMNIGRVNRTFDVRLSIENCHPITKSRKTRAARFVIYQSDWELSY